MFTPQCRTVIPRSGRAEARGTVTVSTRRISVMGMWIVKISLMKSTVVRDLLSSRIFTALVHDRFHIPKEIQTAVQSQISCMYYT